MIVEDLTEEDMEWFVEIAAVNMLRDELRRDELVNVANLYNLARMGIMSKGAFVAKVDGECVGAIGGIVIPNIFNPLLTSLVEVFWYVLPEHRQSRAGLLLLNAFTKRGIELADETTLCLLGTSEVKRGTLEKRGFRLSEFAFRKDNKENYGSSY